MTIKIEIKNKQRTTNNFLLKGKIEKKNQFNRITQNKIKINQKNDDQIKKNNILQI